MPFKAQDFEIVGGKLVKYNGASTEVEIPDSVQVIGTKAFAGCSGITAITIPNTVHRIEGSAFEGCASLTSMSIPDSVTTIGQSAFQDCFSLKSVSIPDSVRELKEYITAETFSGCIELETVRLSKNIEKIGSYTFWNCKKLKEIVIPEGVKIIEDRAFSGGLEKVTLPYSLQKLDVCAFGDCTGACENLTYIEGNSDIYFARKINLKNINPSAKYTPPAVDRYVQTVVKQRRQNHLCTFCGGKFKGLVNKSCAACGSKKDY